MTVDEVLRLTGPARSMVVDIRAGEDNAEDLALWLEVNGADNGAYTYDMWFQQAADAGAGDAVQEMSGLMVVVAAGSVDKIRGATLDVGVNGSEQGLVMLNPNTPAVMLNPNTPAAARSAMPARPEADLSGPVAQRILSILEEDVNPQIAMHGGWADLVAFEEGIAYVRMSGGCQGCGLAKVTLGQGIAVAIQDAVPEVTDVVDVTDHALGENPYYEAAKK